MSGREIVILGAARTPIGKFMGRLSGFSARQLGALAAGAAIERAGISHDQVEEVIFGNVLQAGLGQNPARQVAVDAGIPLSVSAFTVNKVCGSGLKAVALAAQAIKAGDADIVVAGGTESMSHSPYLLSDPRLRSNRRLGNLKISELMNMDGDIEALDEMQKDGLTCAITGMKMGIAAELVAEKYGFSRTEQDAYALDSHRRAIEAAREGRFKDELVPVEMAAGIFDRDESPRENTSIEKLATLQPIFKQDGTITSGNASGINDGAAALVIASAEKAQELGITPMAKIEGYGTGALEPESIMLAPILATTRLLGRLVKRVGDIEIVELNEAFAAQCMAFSNEMGISPIRINVNGGAIALGHPIGASGARILVTLVHAMRQRKKNLGLATLCLGGGDAVAMMVSRI